MERPFTIPDGSLINNQYRLGKELGYGAYGVVFQCVDTHSGDTPFAIKLVRAKQREPDIFQQFLEAAEGLRLNHPNILKLVKFGRWEYTERQIYYYYLMPLAEMNLEGWLATGGRSEAEKILVLGQIAQGLSHMHKAGLVHRDLKPKNIVVLGGIAKIADLGSVRHYDGHTANTEKPAGTPGYQPSDKHKISPKLDIYSFATTCLHVFGINPRNLEHGEDGIPIPNFHLLPKKIQKIVTTCLGPRNERMKIEEVLSHFGLLDLDQEFSDDEAKSEPDGAKTAIKSLELSGETLLFSASPLVRIYRHTGDNSQEDLIRMIEEANERIVLFGLTRNFISTQPVLNLLIEKSLTIPVEIYVMDPDCESRKDRYRLEPIEASMEDPNRFKEVFLRTIIRAVVRRRSLGQNPDLKLFGYNFPCSFAIEQIDSQIRVMLYGHGVRGTNGPIFLIKKDTWIGEYFFDQLEWIRGMGSNGTQPPWDLKNLIVTELNNF